MSELDDISEAEEGEEDGEKLKKHATLCVKTLVC